MSIDKGSSGFPEVNVHRRTTKVNLWMIAAIVGFLAGSAATAFWVSRHPDSPAGEPPQATEKR